MAKEYKGGKDNAGKLSSGLALDTARRAILSLYDFQGRALGEKNPIGKSREVRSPAGASRITGIEFTTTDAVAISPCEPPGITRLILG